MWFRDLVGFREETPQQVREKLKVEGPFITSLENGVKLTAGHLEIVSLEELRNRNSLGPNFSDKLKICQIVGDITELHRDIQNQNALFQAASQFNLLEMIDPCIIPENGIDRYAADRTQGPACAIACGAGTIYRNYFVPIHGQIGQSAKFQIDCLDEIGKVLDNKNNQCWIMKNGYMLPSSEGLNLINQKLDVLNENQIDDLFSKLKVGIQWNTQVTISEEKHLVSQIYCSAVPVRYTNLDARDWEKFARNILLATYEATFLTAIENLKVNKSNILFLTLVGGGAFGNKLEWILDAIRSNAIKYKHYPLQIKLVSYDSKHPKIEELVQVINSKINL